MEKRMQIFPGRLNIHVKKAAVVTPHFQFKSDGTAAGAVAVGAMQTVAEGDYLAARDIFGLGDVPSLPFVVTVDPTAGGAYHYSCEGTEIWVIPDDAASLLVAETTECFMALQGKIDCGFTAGEGLSRALAMEIRPFRVILGIDGDVQGWWNGGNPADYWNDNSNTDQFQPGNACGTLSFFYFRYQLGYTWKQIVATSGKSIGEIYTALTGKDATTGFNEFVSVLRGVEVNGNLVVPQSGNPFPIGVPIPVPVPTPVPVPVPIPVPVPASNDGVGAVIVVVGLIVLGIIAFFLLHH
jgi:hypothetical protein